MLKHRPTYRDALFAARLIKGDKYDVRDDTGKFSESPGGGGGKKTAKPKREGTPQEIANQNRNATADATGIGQELGGTLIRLEAGMGGTKEAEKADQLVERGLAVKDPDTGRYSLSPEGKAYMRAAKKGDVESAKAAVANAKGRAEKVKAKAAQAKAKADAKTKATEDKAKAKAEAEKEKAKGGGGGGGKPSPEDKAKEKAEAQTKQRTANRTAVKDAMAERDEGLSPSGTDALLDFAGGGMLGPDAAKALGELGMVEGDPPRLSAAGKAFVSAADKGNVRGALDAVSAGQERAARAKASPAKATKVLSYRDALWLGRSVDLSAIQKRASAARAATFVLFDADAIAKAGDERMVYGIASTNEIDDQPGKWRDQRYDGDIVETEAIADALDDYMQWANVREMHQDHKAVGVVTEAKIIDGKLHIAARIEDDDAWKKVKAGVYKGFSIGGRAILARFKQLADGRIARCILKLLLTEISLVDRPANSGARILLFKGADMSDGVETPERPDALAQLAALAVLAKAAPDPMKATTQLQAIRDELELAGDVQGAALMTNAISLVLQAAGEAEAPAGEVETEVETETEAEAPADDVEMAADIGDSEEQDPATLMMGARASLLKASRLRMGKRLPGIEAIAKQMLQLAADGGSEWAIKLLKGEAPTDMKALLPELTKAVEAQLTKAMQPVAAGILHIHERTQALEAQPAPGGPVRNLQPIAKRLGAEQPQGRTTAEPNPDRVAELRRLIATETHAGRREAYRKDLAAMAAE